MSEITGKLRKNLNNDIWYHGTLLSNWEILSWITQNYLKLQFHELG